MNYKSVTLFSIIVLLLFSLHAHTTERHLLHPEWKSLFIAGTLTQTAIRCSVGPAMNFASMAAISKPYIPLIGSIKLHRADLAAQSWYLLSKCYIKVKKRRSEGKGNILKPLYKCGISAALLLAEQVVLQKLVNPFVNHIFTDSSPDSMMPIPSLQTLTRIYIIPYIMSTIRWNIDFALTERKNYKGLILAPLTISPSAFFSVASTIKSLF